MVRLLTIFSIFFYSLTLAYEEDAKGLRDNEIKDGRRGRNAITQRGSVDKQSREKQNKAVRDTLVCIKKLEKEIDHTLPNHKIKDPS